MTRPGRWTAVLEDWARGAIYTRIPLNIADPKAMQKVCCQETMADRSGERLHRIHWPRNDRRAA